VVNEENDGLVLATNPLDPDSRTRLKTADIVSRKISETSPMSAGLVNTLQREEILDLLNWLAQGEP
jgi:hypothetical protein